MYFYIDKTTCFGCLCTCFSFNNRRYFCVIIFQVYLCHNNGDMSDRWIQTFCEKLVFLTLFRLSNKIMCYFKLDFFRDYYPSFEYGNSSEGMYRSWPPSCADQSTHRRENGITNLLCWPNVLAVMRKFSAQIAGIRLEKLIETPFIAYREP